MDHPKEIGAVRFFARLRAFDLECPRCGIVYQVTQKQTRDDARPSTCYDYPTARFTCRACCMSWVLGLLAWPSEGEAVVPPSDQVPGPRELPQLRREGWGWWLPARKDRPAELVGPPEQSNVIKRKGKG